MPSSLLAATEVSLPLETLLRLKQAGPAEIPRILELVRRGDWKVRVLALSAVGAFVGKDPTAHRFHVFRHLVARRVPALARRFPSVGLRGAFVRNHVVHKLRDWCWIVRTAAALVLGECGEPSMAAALRPLLEDRFRSVRLAAAAALARCGAAPESPADTLFDGCEATPARIGDTGVSLEWLERLATAHTGVLEAWTRVPGARGPEAAGAAGWARFLAGPLGREETDSREAEILRYAQEKEFHYNVTKPFTHVNRDQNVRFLHAFLAVVENMRVPLQGRVLDLGGGAAWVSELLAKLGYRPITVDIATALLRVGQDRFTREHLPFRPVAADMAALPVSSGSVDAVVVIDALHHVPDVAAVFREAFRVLATGGQFLLAEPGEGHAETDKSRAEMDVHGVCEGEVHLFEAVRYGREAGFDDVRVIPHYVPNVGLTPEGLHEAMVTPSERWQVWEGRSRSAFDELVLQSMLSHPILAFAKGERALDSRMPRQLRASLRPRLARDGSRVRGVVDLTNAGDTLWLRGGDEPGRVRLGLQLMTPERKLLNLDFARGPLPCDVAPGTTAEVALDVVLPDAAAAYVLKLDMVDEHVCWFEDVGSKPVYVSV